MNHESKTTLINSTTKLFIEKGLNLHNNFTQKTKETFTQNIRFNTLNGIIYENFILIRIRTKIGLIKGLPAAVSSYSQILSKNAKNKDQNKK